MDDAVKISKEMWHRSCCSVVDGSRSEWKLDAREYKAEVGEIEGGQQKTGVLKIWKKKKTTLKRRSSQMGTSAVSIPVSAKTPKPKRKSTARGGKRSAVIIGQEGTTDRADENQESVVEARESRLHHMDFDGAGKRKMGVVDGIRLDAPRVASADGGEPSQESVVEARESRLHHMDFDGAGKRKMEVVDGIRLDAPRVASADGGEPSQVSSSTHTARHSKVRSESTRVAPHRQMLPFVCGSTTTSHNVAVNVQKLLSSLKSQQVPRGIPPNFANHVGTKKFLDFVLPNPPVPGRSACKPSAGAGVAGRSINRALLLLSAGDGPLPLQSRPRRTKQPIPIKLEKKVPVERVNVR